MKYLKILGTSLLYVLIITVSLTFLITIFSYFNIFSDNITKVFKLLTPIIGMFVGGILMGTKTNKKGFLEGIKLGVIVDIILVIISLITNSIKISSILFYIILIMSAIFGSMIGINKKAKTN